MFSKCYSFSGEGLENWNTQNLIYVKRMFYKCKFTVNFDLPNCKDPDYIYDIVLH